MWIGSVCAQVALEKQKHATLEEHPVIDRYMSRFTLHMSTHVHTSVENMFLRVKEIRISNVFHEIH